MISRVDGRAFVAFARAVDFEARTDADTDAVVLSRGVWDAARVGDHIQPAHHHPERVAPRPNRHAARQNVRVTYRLHLCM